MAKNNSKENNKKVLFAVIIVLLVAFAIYAFSSSPQLSPRTKQTSSSDAPDACPNPIASREICIGDKACKCTNQGGGTSNWVATEGRTCEETAPLGSLTCRGAITTVSIIQNIDEACTMASANTMGSTNNPIACISGCVNQGVFSLPPVINGLCCKVTNERSCIVNATKVVVQ